MNVEKEIQARVEFKMNEFLTALKNTLQFKHGQMWDMTHKSQYSHEAFKEVSEIMKKEIYIPTPSNQMDEEKKREAKNKAVDKIVESIDLRGRSEYNAKINTIVSAIEEAQNY
jgi:hypothetical protein